MSLYVDQRGDAYSCGGMTIPPSPNCGTPWNQSPVPSADPPHSTAGAWSRMPDRLALDL